MKHSTFEDKIKPKLIASLIVSVLILIIWINISGRESYPRALYRTQNIDSIYIQIDSNLLWIKDPARIDIFTRTMLRSKTKVKSKNQRGSFYHINIGFAMNDGSWHGYRICNIGQNGNVIDVNFNMYKGDSILHLIDSLYYKFPPGTPGFPLFQHQP
ncbi:MAG: hypothetical protein ACTHMC_10565 [Pseudobacter sp.]|uniref:hypothetical protein n=1 Tax=Pseudobacter sp. TaxID=2045420 RepID=UPI003F7DE790